MYNLVALRTFAVFVPITTVSFHKFSTIPNGESSHPAFLLCIFKS